MVESIDPKCCSACKDVGEFPFKFSMAFQPIMDLNTGYPVAYEALVRGTNGEGAGQVLSWVNDTNKYKLDQACRIKAIEIASKLGLKKLRDCKLTINFLPNAIYQPESSIRATVDAAKKFDFPLDRLVFEVTEVEPLRDAEHLSAIFKEYRRMGLLTAIDDFGAGYAGLNMLAQFQPRIIKIDMDLVRGIDKNLVRQAIVEGIALVCKKLSIHVVAEGIETHEESDYLMSLGIHYQQGYLFAKPGFETLPLSNGIES